MKKYLLLLCVLLLVGCQKNEEIVEVENEHNESDKKIEEQVSSESELELSKKEMIQEGEVRVFDDTYLAESILDDLNGDGIEDEIYMYISPPPIFNEQGEAAWDDSHVWQLIVSIDGKSYSLFDESARGLLDFWTVGDDGERELVLFESGQSLILYKYKFVDNHFIKEIILYEEFVNKRSLSSW